MTKISLDQARASETTAPDACAAGREDEQLTDPCPNPDRRIFNTIWSWADGDRGQHGDRALLGTGKRWVSANGTSGSHRFACARPRTGAPETWDDERGADWHVTNAKGAWSDGFRVCAAEFPGFMFSVPVNGWANKQLLAKIEESASLGRSVWLNYRRPGPVGTDWETSWRTSKTTVFPPQGAVYNGLARRARPEVTGDGGAAIPNSDVILTYSGRDQTTYGPTTEPPTAAGDYKVSATFPGNADYQPSSSDEENYSIDKRRLTVTAHDKIRHIHTENPTLTGTLNGVVAEDGITARYRTDAVASSPPGNYPIYPELVDLQNKLTNYDITKTNGTLRVVVPIEITAPSDGQVIELGASVLARYTCSPLIVFCLGPVQNGTPIDVTTVGEKAFTVTAFDSRWFRVLEDGPLHRARHATQRVHQNARRRRDLRRRTGRSRRLHLYRSGAGQLCRHGRQRGPDQHRVAR